MTMSPDAAEGHGYPPGPSLPSLVQTALFLRRPFEFVRSCQHRYGDIFTLRILTAGRVVYLADPQAVRQLLALDGRQAHAGDPNSLLAPVTGRRSILLLDRDDHLAERRMLTPAFHGEAIRQLEVVAREAAEREETRWPTDEPIRARPAMQRITFEIITRAVLGVDDPRLRDRLLELFEPVFTASVLAGAPIVGTDFGRLSPGGRFKRHMARLDAALFELIARRRAGLERRDVLGLLLAARDAKGHPLTDRHIRDELVTLLLAGHETTATALAWALERLARHPGVLHALREEIRQEQTELLDAVIQETLRVRPVVMDVARRLSASVELCGHNLPAGTIVMPAIYLVHLDSRNYECPQNFLPDRFADGTDVATYLPFGGGRRRCLGAALALMEMRVVLSTLIARRRPEPTDPRDERARLRGVTFVPEHDAELTMRPVQPQAKVGVEAGFTTLLKRSLVSSESGRRQR
jgi:cytochrome P450